MRYLLFVGLIALLILYINFPWLFLLTFIFSLVFTVGVICFFSFFGCRIPFDTDLWKGGTDD